MGNLTKKILITGGGSGGHVSAATGIIEELEARYANALEQILYVGGKLVTETGRTGKSYEEARFENSRVPFVSIRGGKLQRRLTPQSLKLLWGVFGGYRDALKVINEFKPDFVISTGGFVSLPVCYAAKKKRIPVYLHEQTAAIGLANKMVGKFAKKIFVSFPQSIELFKDRSKVIHTGNIVRKAIWNVNPNCDICEPIKKMLPNKEKLPIVLIAGGGQGSHFINVTVRQMLRYALQEYQIILQTGDNSPNHDYDIMEKERLKLPDNLRDRFYVTKYYSDQDAGFLFKNIDYYVGRAGANIVYEMGILRKPSIFIPIPWVTHDEQTKNAQIMVDCGLGKIIPEGEVTAEKLSNELLKFKKLCNRGGYCGDIDKLDQYFIKGAAEKILDEILG